MINLGDEVKDSITGFTGVVISRHEYLHGCMRLTVQPSTLKDGKPIDCVTFDEPQLQVIKAKKISVGSRDKGGPRNEPKRAAIPAR